MKNLNLTVLGNDYIKTTEFIENLILNTKASKDQEHIKMSIIINNKLLEKNEEQLLKIIDNIEKSDTNLICLCFNDENIYNFLENNTTVKILNRDFTNQDNLIFNILNIFYGDENL